MKCTVIVLYIAMEAICWSVMSVAETSCQYSPQCKDKYRSCCGNQCVYRRYCDNFCRRDGDCGPNDQCIYNGCRTKDKPCDCATSEKCVDGKCQTIEDNPKSSTSFSTESIVGVVSVLIIVGCIAFSIYCVSRNRQRQRQHQVPARQDATIYDVPVVPETEGEPSIHGQQHHVPVRQDASLHEVPAVTDAEIPTHPGGPPPYHSLERLDRVEESPPPTYEEALRNSQEIEITV